MGIVSTLFYPLPELTCGVVKIAFQCQDGSSLRSLRISAEVELPSDSCKDEISLQINVELLFQ
jgi:hypothetical protein